LLKAGRNALGYIEKNRGGTDQTIDLICDVLETVRPLSVLIEKKNQR
jgi:hypothetical protein